MHPKSPWNRRLLSFYVWLVGFGSLAVLDICNLIEWSLPLYSWRSKLKLWLVEGMFKTQFWKCWCSLSHNSALERLHSLSSMFSVRYLLTSLRKAKQWLPVWEFSSYCLLCLCGSDPGLTFNEKKISDSLPITIQWMENVDFQTPHFSKWQQFSVWLRYCLGKE